MKTHQDEHSAHRCTTCKFTCNSDEKLKEHIQLHHETVRVDLQRANILDEAVVSCKSCEFKCKLNIQLRNHVNKKHIFEKIFKCNFCDYEANQLLSIYEHKLTTHPESPYKLKPNQDVKDVVLNLLAEQNLALFEEISDLKAGLKGSFEQLSQECKEYANESTNTILGRINNLEYKNSRKESTEPIVTQPSQVSHSPPVPSPSTPATHPVSASLSSRCPKKQSRPEKFKKKKSKYLQKPKVLVVGDSVTHAANFAQIEKQTKTRIKSTKAYSAVKNEGSRYPIENFTDVTERELFNTPEEDEFTHLVLGAPTVDISDLETSKLKSNDNIEIYKQNTFISCQNMLSVAKHAVQNHQKLEKVVIMEHAPRDDPEHVDPTGLKVILAEYANFCLTQMVENDELKDKIIVGKHNLGYGKNDKHFLFKDDWFGRYDGVHLYNKHSKDIFTESVCQIVKSVCPSQNAQTLPTNTYSDHTTCPQALYQQRKYHQNKYNIPVQNKFELLD